MKVSLNWLREYVDINLAPDDLARKLGIDRGALDGMLEQLVKQGKPDMVDIRPGISVLRATKILKDNLNGIPIICSGFIQDSRDIRELLQNHVTAVTTSNKKLWDLYT